MPVRNSTRHNCQRLVSMLVGALSLCQLATGIVRSADEPPAAVSGAATAAAASAGKLTVFPVEFTLRSSRSRQQLLASAAVADGRESDLTRTAKYESVNPQVAEVSTAGVVIPHQDGLADIRVTVGDQTAVARVTVQGLAEPSRVDFRTDVVAAISRAGCNQGACHGSPQGKDGFRLSLRGFDPDLDYTTLAREADGRRTNRFDPPQSLILLKASGKLPHQGGVRFHSQDHAYRTLVEWIAAGCLDSGAPRKLLAVDVHPIRRTLSTNSRSQQVVALARFDNGSVVDVTHEAVFTTALNSAVAVSADGLVTFDRTAESTILVRYLDQIRAAQLTYVEDDPGFVFRGPESASAIDQQVFAKQRELQLNPAPRASDAVFLRRVYLDVIGGLPSEAEACEFLDSTAVDKRERLVERLLERDEFAYFWALKWADVMRGNRTTISVRGVHSLQRYLVDHFAADRPFTQLAREILTSSGNTLHRPDANFYRVAPTPEDAAESFAQLFLGVRIQCAKCHNHPFESITQTDYYSLAAFFARVKIKGKQFGLEDEIVYVDRQGEVQHPLTRKNLEPAAFGTAAGPLSADDDRRAKLADWLTAADNRYFARSTANRIWFQLVGHGVVDPVDDFRDTNPPSNPALLDTLAQEFARGGYRLKPLVRLIVNSRTYQLAADPRQQQSPRASDSTRYFTRATVRMLTAEQAIDSISAVLGLSETFPGYPPGTRAIELAEGAVENHFLMSFARPIRDAACDCAREDEPSLNEALHLLNNPDLVRRIESPQNRLGRWLAANRSTSDIVESLYLIALSRRPTDAERQLADRHVSEVANRSAALRDLVHALFNSNEFLLRH